MNKLKTNKKAVVLSLALAAGLLLPLSMNAQDRGLFGLGGNGDNGDNVSMMNRDGATIGNGVELGGATTENPTEAPLGSGIAFLVVAGAGYALLKRKEDKQ